MSLALQGVRSSIPLDGVLHAARHQLTAPIENIGITDSSATVLSVSYTGRSGEKRALLVDASSGRFLKDREWRPTSPSTGNFWRWLYNLHHELLAGDAGKYFMGLSGLLLGTSVVWGTWIAWPRRKQWSQLFRFACWRTVPQQVYGWHRLVGIVAAPVLLLLALSGASMDFSKQLSNFAASALAYRAPYTVKPGRLSDKLISAQEAVSLAQGQLPAAAFVSVSLPSPQKPVYQVRLRQPGEWRSWSGTSIVTLNPASGAILDTYDAATAPLTNRVLESAFAVHSGEAGGFFTRTAVLLAGISLPALYALGLWSWLGRRRLRRTRDRSPA